MHIVMTGHRIGDRMHRRGLCIGKGQAGIETRLCQLRPVGQSEVSNLELFDTLSQQLNRLKCQ